MQYKLSKRYNVYLNVDNFEKREQVVEKCAFYARSKGRSFSHVILCINLINSLDSNFPFDAVTGPLLNMLTHMNHESDNITNHIKFTIDFVNKLIRPNNYREFAELFDTLPGVILEEGMESYMGFPVSLRKVFRAYCKIGRLISEVKGYGNFFDIRAFNYISAAMLAEAWLNGEENFDYIKEEINNLLNNFNAKEFTLLRGLQSLAKVGPPGDNISIYDNETGFGLKFSSKDNLYDIFDYIYCYLKEQKTNSGPTIK